MMDAEICALRIFISLQDAAIFYIYDGCCNLIYQNDISLQDAGCCNLLSLCEML